MPITRNRGACRGKATQKNLTAYDGSSQTRSQRRRQQFLNGNKKDIAFADAERERLETKAEDQRNQKRARLNELEEKQIRLEGSENRSCSSSTSCSSSSKPFW